MRKFVTILMVMVAVIAIVVASAEAVATTIVYAQNQNATTIQQRNYSNTITAIPQIKGLNASTIIDTINSKIRSVYDDKGEMPIINKIRH